MLAIGPVRLFKKSISQIPSFWSEAITEKEKIVKKR
jgi:hypothetical protein